MVSPQCFSNVYQLFARPAGISVVLTCRVLPLQGSRKVHFVGACMDGCRMGCAGLGTALHGSSRMGVAGVHLSLFDWHVCCLGASGTQSCSAFLVMEQQSN